MNSTVQKILIVFAGILVVIALLGVYKFNFTKGSDVVPVVLTQLDPGAMTYYVNGETFVLKNSKAETMSVSGSSSKNTLMIFGEPVYGDLDKDGDIDSAVLLVNTTGGSGYSMIFIGPQGSPPSDA